MNFPRKDKPWMSSSEVKVKESFKYAITIKKTPKSVFFLSEAVGELLFTSTMSGVWEGDNRENSRRYTDPQRSRVTGDKRLTFTSYCDFCSQSTWLHEPRTCWSLVEMATRRKELRTWWLLEGKRFHLWCIPPWRGKCPSIAQRMMFATTMFLSFPLSLSHTRQDAETSLSPRQPSASACTMCCVPVAQETNGFMSAWLDRHGYYSGHACGMLILFPDKTLISHDPPKWKPLHQGRVEQYKEQQLPLAFIKILLKYPRWHTASLSSNRIEM